MTTPLKLRTPPVLAGAAAPHLTRAGAQGWRLWRDAVLRSTGFPAEHLLSLADPALAAATCLLDTHEAATAAAWRAAQRHLKACLDGLLARLKDGDPEHTQALAACKRALKDAQRCRPAALAALPADSALALNEALQRTEAARRSFETAYEQALTRSAEALRKAAGDPLLRQAVSWQNHAALTTALDPLARGEDMAGTRRRQREALLTNYLQRYCLKNDTIGFFGPMAWIRLGGEGTGHFERGPALVGERTVRFEDWPLHAYAERLAADPAMRPWLAPRLQPICRLENDCLYLPGGACLALEPGEAQLLSLCDGVTPAGIIAEALLANPFSAWRDSDDILEALERLYQADRIQWGFRVPTTDPQPELTLEQELLQLPDEAPRHEALQGLKRLCAARDVLAQARGDDARLAEALQDLDAVFHELTGSAPRRRGGEPYGGRALVYEDCHRDIKVEWPETALDRLRGPLDFVLSSGRWFTARAAESFQARFLEAHAALMGAGQANGQGRVALHDFWLRIQSIVFVDQEPIVALAQELRQRWEQLLKPFDEPGQRRVERRCTDLMEAFVQAFPQQGRVWAQARYQSPDLMFCTTDAAGWLQGKALAVLGEVHLGCNTIATNMFASLHPQPERLRAQLRADLGDPYPLPRLSTSASATPIRTQWLEDPAGIVEILFSLDAVPRNPSMAKHIADLDVVREGDRLVVRDERDGWSADLLDVVGDFLSLSVMNHFGVLHRRVHTPRITLDRLVVQRESWRVPVAQLAAVLEGVTDDRAAFRALHRMAAEQGWPERVFVKAPWEDKPFFCDLSSPLLVRHLAKQVRAGGVEGDIVVSEMLPDVGDLWLQDAQGERYASELRVVCVHGDDIRITQEHH
ncbi:lantibiotic dehydratase [Roseateles sp. BYS96W]|uniref:Lantibiotic dehydratase n=1 Tax=Pelomonas nitida TaxID=3299027 RepID=A0ABW7GCU0_9BURK